MLRLKRGCLLVGYLVLSGCWQNDGLAPVVESTWRALGGSVSQHVVIRGETLYAIAFRYDQDYRQLARFNHIAPPYTLRIGQVIQLQRGVVVHHATQQRPSPVYRRPTLIHRVLFKQRWLWPLKGRIVSSFIPQQGKKGIDIAGTKGQKIIASANGVVAYSGSGLAGYGNLIIIKHENEFLTAYGHNQKNLVVEGQTIKAGQVIAEIGMMEHRYWGVHFEIRHSGQPVNPFSYLQ